MHARTAGHAYYFLEDVYPRMTGRRVLKTPGFIKALFPTDEAIPPVVLPQPAAAPLERPALARQFGEEPIPPPGEAVPQDHQQVDD